MPLPLKGPVEEGQLAARALSVEQSRLSALTCVSECGKICATSR